jgi:hypothetical protein
MEKYSREEALKYLVKNRTDFDEWSSAGMCGALVEVIMSEDEFFTKDYLDKLLVNASNF